VRDDEAVRSPTPGEHDVERLLDEMTLDERAALTAGSALFSMTGVERLGIAAPAVTDGPNGARGTALFGLGEETAVCIPCGSALGATWNPDLLERLGALLAEEARTKQCRVLLAPTVNLHRSPLAGRNFECYSEDPLLSGKAAAAFVRGVQSRGVITTVKHFAGNDAEFERQTINSVIDERALRELYLVPFEIAVREGHTLGIMTAYNRLNGPFCSEHHRLITEILRGEWGFDGIVMTDWYSGGSTIGSAHAGLDVEMPGPGGRFFGAHLAEAVHRGEVEAHVVDDQARRLLTTLARVGALEDLPTRDEQSVDLPEHRALAREAATESMVLLRNDGLLPLDAGALQTLAVIGPNAERVQMMGGGSAALAPHYRVAPLDAIRAAFGRVDVRYQRGCTVARRTEPIGPAHVTQPDGTPGFRAEYFAGSTPTGAAQRRRGFTDGVFLTIGGPPAQLAVPYSMRVTGQFTPPEDGTYQLTLAQAGGTARLLVDGHLVLDGGTAQSDGRELFGLLGSAGAAEIDMTAGDPVDLVVQYSSPTAGFLHGATLGCRPPSPPDLLDRAVAAAAAADVAVVIVGTNAEWESEGHDRSTMHLPGEQDELVARVTDANPRTVVLVNAGSPVSMDWADAAAAVLQVWFGGQEMANAIADVLTGAAEPGGRLPTTIPDRLEHNPSFGNFPGENGEIRYGEGLLMGYRWYDARSLAPRFPFGHGLSYSTFEIGDPVPSTARLSPGQVLRLEIPVTNTGPRRGSEVVQCYVAPVAPRLSRPPKELKGFEKVTLDPGETGVVVLELGPRAFQYWDPGPPPVPSPAAAAPSGAREGDADPEPTRPGWRADPGPYRLLIGRSSADLAHTIDVELVE
jgi:beta-glucosidase